MGHHAKCPPCLNAPEAIIMRPFHSLRKFSSSSWIYTCWTQNWWRVLRQNQLEYFFQSSWWEKSKGNSYFKVRLVVKPEGRRGVCKGLAGSDSVTWISFCVCIWLYLFSCASGLKNKQRDNPSYRGKGGREQGQMLPLLPPPQTNWICSAIGMASCFSFWGPVLHILQAFFFNPFYNPIRQIHKHPILKTLQFRAEEDEMSKVAWQGHRGTVLPDFSPHVQKEARLHSWLRVSVQCPSGNQCPVQLLLQSDKVTLGQQGEQESPLKHTIASSASSYGTQVELTVLMIV